VLRHHFASLPVVPIIGAVMSRLVVLLILAAPGAVPSPTHGLRSPSFSVVEATIPEMQAALREGRVTSRELVHTPGPMARTVTDAAVLLGALEGAAPDPRDSATKACAAPPGRDYLSFLKRDGLRGARIGIPRVGYFDTLPPEKAKPMAEAVAVLRKQGAVIVDPADIPSIVDKDLRASLGRFGRCGDMESVRNKTCSIVFAYGMLRDFNQWLGSLGSAAPVKTLTELRRWNRDHDKEGAIRFGQIRLDFVDQLDLELHRARYESDRARDLFLAGTHGIDEVMKGKKLDALLFPGSKGTNLAATPGYPTVTVPFALVPNVPTPPFPKGFDAKPGPFGVAFTGLACKRAHAAAPGVFVRAGNQAPGSASRVSVARCHPGR
jgi:amidase